MSLYKGNGPAGIAAWNVWRTGISRKIEKPTRLKTCVKGYPHNNATNPLLPVSNDGHNEYATIHGEVQS